MPYPSSLSDSSGKGFFCCSYCSVAARGIFLCTEGEERDQKALVCLVSRGEDALFKNLGAP